MTDATIAAVTEKYGLTVNKRVTTGQPKGDHFGVYELSGKDYAILREAAQELRHTFGEVQVLFVNVKEHPDYGKPYIEVESVWHSAPRSPARVKMAYTTQCRKYGALGVATTSHTTYFEGDPLLVGSHHPPAGLTDQEWEKLSGEHHHAIIQKGLEAVGFPSMTRVENG